MKSLVGRRHSTSLALVAFVLGASGCGTLFDVAALHSGGGEEASPDADADARIDASADPNAADASAEEEDSSAPCVSETGPLMKRIGGYCIDTTEVTNAQYMEFLVATDGGAAGPAAPGCEQAVDRTPTERWPPRSFDIYPVMGTSWCDAHAYCAFAGKRLCGSRSGGTLSASDTSNAAVSEWYRACTKNGTRTYPYGDELIPEECATSDLVRFVGQACEGGYAGIFDMVGNAEEWIDSCAAAGGSKDTCMTQGGGTPDPRGDCKTVHAYLRAGKYPTVGIRCCAN